MSSRKSSAGVDILFYAEDPGAANFIVHLPAACRERGFSSSVLAGWAAAKAFSESGTPFEEISSFTPVAEALERYSPRMVIAGTSEDRQSPGLALVKEARRTGIPSVGAVDAFMNAAFRFRGNTKHAFAFAPDYILVPDRWTKEEFVKIGFRDDHIVACGHPHYDFVRQRAQTFKTFGKERMRAGFFPKKARDRVIAIFAAETSTGLNPKQFSRSSRYTLTGRGDSSKRTDIVLEEFLDALPKEAERPYLVLRLHPKNEREEFGPYIAEFDQVSKEEPALELVFGGDCVIGITTTLLLEATLMERPTFSIVPREIEKGWLPSVRAGLTLAASTRKEIRDLLPGFLKDVSGGKPVCPDKAFVFDAKDRVVSFIESILRQ